MRSLPRRRRAEGASDDAITLVPDFDNQKHELPDRQREAIEFGRKAALALTTVTDADVATLKEHSFTDSELVELTLSGLSPTPSQPSARCST